MVFRFLFLLALLISIQCRAWNPVPEPPKAIQELNIRLLKGAIDDQELIEQIAQLLDTLDKENRFGDNDRYRLLKMAGTVPYFPPPGHYLMSAFGKTMPEPTPAQVKASLQNRRIALAKYAKGPFQPGSRYGEINSRYLYLSAGMVGVPIDQHELLNSLKIDSGIPLEMILTGICAQEKIDPSIRSQLEHYATSEEPLAVRPIAPDYNPRNTDPMAQAGSVNLEQYFPIKELARKALSKMDGKETTSNPSQLQPDQSQLQPVSPNRTSENSSSAVDEDASAGDKTSWWLVSLSIILGITLLIFIKKRGR